MALSEAGGTRAKGPRTRQAIPAYVINLDRRPDRWETISENLDRIGVAAERIPAVEAQALADRDRWEIEHGNRPLHRINYGSAACMMGHAAAMKSLLLRPEVPAALILEDDAELAPDTLDHLQAVDWWPEGTLAVRLEQSPRSKGRLLWRSCGKSPSGRDLCRFERGISGSAAYLISRRGAEIVLDAFYDPRHPTDGILFNMLSSPTARRLRPVQIVPPLARQDLESSDLYEWRVHEKATIMFSRLLLRTLHRNVWTLPWRVRMWFLMLFGIVRKRRVVYEPQPTAE